MTGRYDAALTRLGASSAPRIVYKNLMTTVALIVAAGRGTRFGTETPKQYNMLLGKPVLAWTIESFLNHRGIDQVRVVIHPDDRALYDHAVGDRKIESPKIMGPISGGDTRQASVKAGLDALVGDPCTRVLIHDAARPIVPGDMIDRILSGLDHAPGVLPALAVVDSLRKVADGVVSGTLDRDGVVRAQTPQGFRFDAIHAAHSAVGDDHSFTDDVAILDANGGRIIVVAGDDRSLKITENADMSRIEQIILQNLTDIRVGSGFDVHTFGTGDHVTLCGLKIPHSHGLVGHSDADVGLHAITDAILGGLSEGDIGQAFPPSDPQWRGVDSAVFLNFAKDRVTARHGIIAHVDVTIICERPKVSPHRDAMRTRISDILRIDLSRVSVKATTTEKLGFTGRGEGIAAQATVTLRLP